MKTLFTVDELEELFGDLLVAERNTGFVEGPKDRVHGTTCEKKPHNDPHGGYLHDHDDDKPYSVDGWAYCGRCHEALG